MEETKETSAFTDLPTLSQLIYTVVLSLSLTHTHTHLHAPPPTALARASRAHTSSAPAEFVSLSINLEDNDHCKSRISQIANAEWKHGHLDCTNELISQTEKTRQHYDWSCDQRSGSKCSNHVCFCHPILGQLWSDVFSSVDSNQMGSWGWLWNERGPLRTGADPAFWPTGPRP